MKFKIVADSSCDVDKSMEARMNIQIVPLTLEVEGVRYIDDETFDVDDYLAKAHASSQNPKSSCPSPDDYLRAFKGEEEGVFGITLSSELSGSFASANLAKNLYQDQDPSKKIHIFDSKSAASGEALIAIKIQECIEEGMSFEEIVETVEAFVAEMATVFILEKIDHLQKAGRMSKTKLTIANVLNIKLILKANEHGEVELHDQARGTKKAIEKLVKTLPQVGKVSSQKIIVIAECQAEEKAKTIQKMIQDMYDFRDVIIVKMRGLSSNYANSGGIVISF